MKCRTGLVVVADRLLQRNRRLGARRIWSTRLRRRAPVRSVRVRLAARSARRLRSVRRILSVSDHVHGHRIVRALSASARATAWRIHQVASWRIEPLRWSNFSRHGRGPIVPSGSDQKTGALVAIAGDRHDEAKVRLDIPASPMVAPRSIRFASSISRAASTDRPCRALRKSWIASVETSRSSTAASTSSTAFSTTRCATRRADVQLVDLGRLELELVAARPTHSEG